MQPGSWRYHSAPADKKQQLKEQELKQKQEAGSSDEEEVQGHGSQQPLDNSELPAALWDQLPENYESHPDYMAMEALRADCTPEELATTSKVNGNKKLQMGVKVKNKILLREAIDLYTKGLSEKCSDNALNAILLCNRAHAESLLGNWRKTLQDGQEAMKLDSTNAKAYFRAARAALKLGEHGLCQELCESGRKHTEPPTTELDALQKEAAAAAAEAMAGKERAAAAEAAAMMPAKLMAHAMTSRGIKLTAPQIRTKDDRWRPTLEEDGSLCWPVVLAYPEAGMAQDTIEEFHESATFGQHLDVMFGPDSPPLEWDTEHAYTRDKVMLLYLSNAGKPLSQSQLIELLRYNRWPSDFDDDGPKKYGPGASKWKEVDETWSLKELLSRSDYVVPGAPLLWVVARGSKYHARLINQS